ncbi:MAG: ABC transporter permease, partial [Terriglobales bacterium]
GIGANATVFSWVRGVVMTPLPGVPDAGQIVALETLTPTGEMIDTSYPDYRDFRDQSRLFDGMIIFKDRPLNLGEGAESRRIWALMVSGNYFDVLGIKPALGRFFSAEEQQEKPGAYPVAVISHGLWRRYFNSDPSVAGKTIKLNRHLFTVIGVAPAEFPGTINGLAFDAYVPLMMQQTLSGGRNWLESRDSRPLYPLGKLKPGVTIEQARDEIRGIAATLARSFPDTNQGLSATLLPIRNAKRGAQSVLSNLLLILMAVGGVVFLIVCANVANLQLARATARQREFGVRIAMGASATRVIRQLLTEGLLVSLLGGAAGALLAVSMTDAIKLFVPVTDLPILLTTPIDAQVLMFTVALSVLSGVLFGLAPALHAASGRVSESLQESGRR